MYQVKNKINVSQRNKRRLNIKIETDNDAFVDNIEGKKAIVLLKDITIRFNLK